MSPVEQRRSAIEVATASLPREGETVSGDAEVIVTAGTVTLFAVLDALGHGPAAAETAGAAVEALRRFTGEPIADLLERCDRELQGTRGAAASFALYDPVAATLTWGGAGNIEGRLLRGGSSQPRAALIATPGAVGVQLPAVRTVTLPVRRGDVLLLATDGIDPSFADWAVTSGPVQQIADGILGTHRRPRDDALVLVARLLGISA